MSVPQQMTATGSWSVLFDGTQVVYGAEVLETLASQVVALEARSVILVTDAGMRAAGHVDRALELLRTGGIEVAVFDGVVTNPTSDTVDRAVRSIAGLAIDCVIGLGGGSVLDCAKGVNFIRTNGGRMEDYWGVDKAREPMLPSIGIPTTAGTGSDAQSFALISHPDSGAKMACGDRKAKFRTVLLDPRLLRTVPRDVAAMAGVDALTHAVESYVSTRRNPVSQLLAREGWCLLQQNLPVTLEDPMDHAAQGAMLLGAHLAGAAIEHSMLGAAHACANPLTARFGVPHGVAVGVMLPPVMRYNEPEVGNLYRRLHQSADSVLGSSLLERFVELRALAGLPVSLGELSIAPESLRELAVDASRQWTASFNPRALGSREILELYEATM